MEEPAGTSRQPHPAAGDRSRRNTRSGGRHPAAGRVRELLRERQHVTEAHVRTVVDARARLTRLAEDTRTLTGQVETALAALLEMGYSRSEIAALCDIDDDAIPRRGRAAGGGTGRNAVDR